MSDNYEAAQFCLVQLASEFDPVMTGSLTALAQANAALALADEMRTANLIALFSLEVTSSTSGTSWGITDEKRTELQMEILKRLSEGKSS